MKLAVIGAGTAGSQTILHLVRHFPNHEIEWYFDPNIPTQSVGEGSPLTLPRNLSENLGFDYYKDLHKVDGTIKTGILKENWGRKVQKYFHPFPPPSSAMHFNAKKLQNFIFQSIKNKVKIYEKNVEHENIDADYTIICSGTPKTLEEYNKSEYIPVNSVFITQCYWDCPKFDHTLTIARPYGWVFGIPLQNRCSIGYLFNNNINTIEEVEEDVKQVFLDYNLNPSENTNHFSFNNYYKKINYTDKICYNGNSSFFLEPLEATSTAMMNLIQRSVYDILEENLTPNDANILYTTNIKQIQNMILMHYFAGSAFDTEFWTYAEELGTKCVEEEMSLDPKFIEIYINMLGKKDITQCHDYNEEYGTWWIGSFLQNIESLGIREKLNTHMFK